MRSASRATEATGLPIMELDEEIAQQLPAWSSENVLPTHELETRSRRRSNSGGREHRRGELFGGRGDTVNPLEIGRNPFSSSAHSSEASEADVSRLASIPYRDSSQLLERTPADMAKYKFNPQRFARAQKDRSLKAKLAALCIDTAASVCTAAALALTAAASAVVVLPEAPGVAFDSFVGGTAVTGVLIAAASKVPWATAGLDVTLVPLLCRASAACREVVSGDAVPTYVAVQAVIFCAVGLCELVLGACQRTKLTSYLPYTVTAGLMGSIGVALATTGAKHALEVGGWHGVAVAVLLAVLAHIAKRHSICPSSLLAPILLAGGAAIEAAVPSIVSRQLPASPNYTGARGWQLEGDADGYVHAWALWHSRGAILAACVVGTLGVGVKCGSLAGLSASADVDQEAMLAGLATTAAAACGCAGQSHSVAALKIQRQLGATKTFASMLVAVWALALWFGGVSKHICSLPRTALCAALIDLGLDYCDTFVAYPLTVSRRDVYDAAVLVAIVAAGSISSTVEAVALGMGLALVGACRQLAKKSVVARLVTGKQARSTLYRTAAALRTLEERGDAIVLLELVGYLFFGSANDLFDAVVVRQGINCLVLDVSRLLPTFDASAVASVEAVLDLSRHKHFSVWIAPADSEAGIEIRKRLQPHDDDLAYADNVDDALESAEDLLLFLATRQDDGDLLIEPEEDLVLDNADLPTFFKTSIQQTAHKLKLAHDFLEGAEVKAPIGPDFASHLAEAAKLLKVQEGESYQVSGCDLFLVAEGRIRLQRSLRDSHCIRKLTAGSLVGVSDFYLKHRDQAAGNSADSSNQQKPILKAATDSIMLVVPHSAIVNFAISSQPQHHALAFAFHHIMGLSLAQKNAASKLRHRAQPASF